MRRGATTTGCNACVGTGSTGAGAAGRATTGAAGAAATSGGRLAGGPTATTGRCCAGADATRGCADGGTATGRPLACWLACSLRSWIAFRTSPGFFTCDRSILGRSPLPLSWRWLDEGPRPPRLKCTRTRSASSPSSELEWVFFSVTPTSSRTSRIARLFTSSSLAKSLIRTLLIRPFYGDHPEPTLNFA
jgi:hypothetical protein